MDFQSRVMEQDVCWRLAARYGLDFYVVDESFITVKESGHQHPEEMREPTGPELDMWRKLVPEEVKELISLAGRFQETPPITATPEEILSSFMFKTHVYMNSEDATVVRQMEEFFHTQNREELKKGMIGTFVHPEYPTPMVNIYVSRDIPRGYYLSSRKEIKGLNWIPPEGKRKIKPPLEERVNLTDLWGSLNPLMVDTHS